jgi:hypothetical protein
MPQIMQDKLGGAEYSGHANPQKTQVHHGLAGSCLACM